MSVRLRDIVHRRRLLVARATAQRGDFAAQVASLKHSLSFVDLVWRGYHHLKSRPVGVALIAAALVMMGPGKLLRMGYRSGLIVATVLRVIKIFRALR
jgi:hypothetical protein